MNKIKQLAARGYTKAILIPASMLIGSRAFAAGESSWDQFFDAADFSGVATKVIAGGLLIVGIAVAFKGPDLAKRLVRKA
ncbi:hypothetical protein [Variovorax gossypii]